MGFIRINAVRGARTIPHTDSIRGPTVNLINFSSLSGNSVNARLMVKCFPAFCTSVVDLYRDLYIPFQYTEIKDFLIMIGPGKTLSSYLPEDCNGSYKDIGFIENSAKFYKFNAIILHELVPYRLLNFAVIGIKEGYL